MARKKGKLPFLQLYVADWIRDTRILSLEARAVWMDLLCLMHDSDRRGYLTSRSGCPFSTEQIAAFCGCSLETATRTVQELVTSGVVSCTDTGTLFSRRMVRDEKKRSLCTEAGKRGGNPTLKGKVKGVVKGRDKPAIASSISSSEEDSGGVGEKGETPPPFDETPAGLAGQWCFYLVRRKLGFPRDQEMDIAAEMAELIRLGVPAKRIRVAILDKARDRGEHFWQFKERLLGGKKGGLPAPIESTDEKIANQIRERAEIERRREEVRNDASRDGQGNGGKRPAAGPTSLPG